MRHFRILFIVLISLTLTASKDEKPAYVIFSGEGRETKFDQMLSRLGDADIILFGEEHDNPIAHWMEIVLVKELSALNMSLVLGAEMFESDDQMIIDEYLSGRIRTNNFEKETKLWDNYHTDYKPWVEYARKMKIPLIATNVPRRYASMVSYSGFASLDSLSSQAKAYIAPLPVEYDPGLPGYSKMREMMNGHSQMGGPSNPDFFSQAQAVKDATMAYFILKNLRPGQCFLHFNGSYHSNNFEGINWYLKKTSPKLKIATINVVSQDNIGRLLDENMHTADFIIVTPSDMTRTY
ncbi:MAG TPA: ChaN family lipoprotein [Cyclobacteriaceae bacterium]|nr:ChaN family lipoprotein [Cyclobacteriaceae bacterium]